MAEIKVFMEWNETAKKWMMLNEDGIFLYDFWHCMNVARIFEGLDRTSKQKYVITIKKDKQG
jgi:hypothetical protein